MFKVKWRKFKSYSGPMIAGTTKHTLGKESSHWERIVWLTAQVETGGKFGATTCYDGTGNTSGLIQGIAVYPKEIAHEDNNPKDDQGALWEMLEYIREDEPKLLERLDSELESAGWKIKDGKVVDFYSELLINGRDIREELTPNQGRVPRFGEDWVSAKGWALIFNDIFSDPRSFTAQVRFGIDHAQRTAKRKPHILRGQSVESIVYRDIKDTKLFGPNDPMDLAMAVFFSNAVNAPAMAFRKLKQAYDIFIHLHGRPNWQNQITRKMFAKRLIRVLGNADFARWNFKLPSGRYQRTRKAAMKVWPSFMFKGPDAVMPSKL